MLSICILLSQFNDAICISMVFTFLAAIKLSISIKMKNSHFAVLCMQIKPSKKFAKNSNKGKQIPQPHFHAVKSKLFFHAKKTFSTRRWRSPLLFALKHYRLNQYPAEFSYFVCNSFTGVSNALRWKFCDSFLFSLRHVQATIYVSASFNLLGIHLIRIFPDSKQRSSRWLKSVFSCTEGKTSKTVVYLGLIERKNLKFGTRLFSFLPLNDCLYEGFVQA